MVEMILLLVESDGWSWFTHNDSEVDSPLVMCDSHFVRFMLEPVSEN